MPSSLCPLSPALTVTFFYSDPEIMQLRAAFDSFDATKDGIISYAEFKQALEKLNYSEDTLKEIFASVVSR
jgi:Ca2+-binding EF-hand superfamily protein